jgi:putative ABC transport system permease protein
MSSPAELVRGAARSLLETRLRSFLTLAGIAIGIGALFSLLSIAEGIRHRIVDEWLSSGLMTSLYVMPPGAPNPMRPRGRPRATAAPKQGETPHTLDDTTLAAINKMSGVRRVWPVISRPVTLVLAEKPAATPGASVKEEKSAKADTTAKVEPGAKGESHPTPETSDQVQYTTLRGMDADYFWTGDYLKILEGAPLSKGSEHEALLADDNLKSLGLADAHAAIGRSLIVRWREPAAPDAPGAQQVPGLPFYVAERSASFRIIGVFEKRGALSLRNAGLLVPTDDAKAIKTLDADRLRALFEGNVGTGGYPGLDVYLNPGADLEGIETKIRDMGFETLSGAEIVSRIRRSILILQAVLGGLGVIAIAVATLGIANTLLTAVYERMREIGVMKAVGARRRDIRRQFFAEAGLIGFIGGVSGLLIGFGADHLLAAVIGQIARRQGGEDPGAIAYHTPGIALGCLAFSVVLSLLAGTFPAARAARLDPIATLRHE